MRYQWISFSTDYGLADGFVAACHGVIAGIAADARVIDVTHQVPPQRIRHGAEVLAQTVRYLPPAVHLAVVDPGVGTARKGVVVVAANGLLVGPDNGLLLPAADALGGVRAAYELTAAAYRAPEVSATFHGRDVFAPAAAHLALGADPESFGVQVDELVRLPAQAVEAHPGQLRAEVLTVDHFGNVAIAATAADLRAAGFTGVVQVRCGDRTLRARFGRTFADVDKGEAVLLLDSSGRPAIAVNGGSAATLLAITPSVPASAITLTQLPGHSSTSGR